MVFAGKTARSGRLYDAAVAVLLLRPGTPVPRSAPLRSDRHTLGPPDDGVHDVLQRRGRAMCSPGPLKMLFWVNSQAIRPIPQQGDANRLRMGSQRSRDWTNRKCPAGGAKKNRLLRQIISAMHGSAGRERNRRTAANRRNAHARAGDFVA